MISTNDLATWKTAALADVNLTAFIAAQDAASIARYYNTVPTSPTMLWMPAVPLAAIKSAIDWTAGANGYQTLTAPKQNAYLALTADGAPLDATNANIRAAFASIFPAAVVTALTAVSQTGATRFQALFTNANVTAYWAYQVSLTDVQTMLGG